MNIVEKAQMVRDAMNYAGATLDDETALICVALYQPWAVDVTYKQGDYFTYGENNLGDPQLYKVKQNHVSQADQTPDICPDWYEPIGVGIDGHPIWSPPISVLDAYEVGDVVDYDGQLYESAVDKNMKVPKNNTAEWKDYSQT